MLTPLNAHTLCASLGADVLTRFEWPDPTINALSRIVASLQRIRFIRTKSNGLSVAAIQTLQFPRVDDQVVRFEMVVFALQLAFQHFVTSRAISAGWLIRQHGSFLYGASSEELISSWGGTPPDAPNEL